MTSTEADPWGGALDGAPVRTVNDHAPEGYTPERGKAAWTEVVHHAGTIVETDRLLGRALLHGAEYQSQNLGGAHLVGLIALLQDVRRSLAQTEALLAARVGRDEAVQRAGVLPDGRQYEVRKGATRKAWAHDEWKHDARRAVLSDIGAETVVVPDTGEAVNLADLLARVQEVHGSGPPRATALRALGLSPDDYCQSVPGPWSVTVSEGGKESSAEG